MFQSTSSKKQVKFCKVCQDAGKTEVEYTSHFTRETPDPTSKVVCPTLLSQECRYCLKKGHTVKYCKVLNKHTHFNAYKQNQMIHHHHQDYNNDKKKSNNKYSNLSSDDEEEETKILQIHAQAQAQIQIQAQTNNSITNNPIMVKSYAAALATKPSELKVNNVVKEVIKVKELKDTTKDTTKVVPKAAPWAATTGNKRPTAANWATMIETDDEDDYEEQDEELEYEELEYEEFYW